MMCDLDIVIAISGWLDPPHPPILWHFYLRPTPGNIHSKLQPQHLQGPCLWSPPKSFAADEKPLALDMALCHGLVLRVSDHITGFMQPDIICIQPGCDHFHIKAQLVSHFYSIHLAIHAELCDAGNLWSYRMSPHLASGEGHLRRMPNWNFRYLMANVRRTRRMIYPPAHLRSYLPLPTLSTPPHYNILILTLG